MNDTVNWQSSFGRTETADAVAAIPGPVRRTVPARRDLVAVPDNDDPADGSAAAQVEDKADGPAPSEVPAVRGGDPVVGASSGRGEFHADGIDAALAAAQRPDPDRSPELTARPREAARPGPAARSTPAVPRRARGAGSSAVKRTPGERLTAAQLRTRRVAQRHADVVVAVLRAGGVDPRVRSANLVEGHVEVMVECPDAQVDEMLDAVADGFSGQDVEVEIGRGTVTLFVAVTDEEPAKQRSVWVPAALRERVRAHTGETGESVSQLAMRAFNAFHDQVGDAFTPDEETQGPLRVATTKRRSGVETPVTLWLYWQRAHEEEIDAAVRLVGAGSRSALMTVLLERYLDSVGS